MSFLNKGLKLYINATYKTGVSPKGIRYHSMYHSKTHKDSNGNYVTDYGVKLTWFSNDIFTVKQEIQILDIVSYEKSSYTDRYGKLQQTDNFVVNVGTMQQSSYGNYNQQPQNNYGYNQPQSSYGYQNENGGNNQQENQNNNYSYDDYGL